MRLLGTRNTPRRKATSGTPRAKGEVVDATDWRTETHRIAWLHDCRPAHVDRAGPKAVGLGRLTRMGLRVPGGFVVTTDVYRESLRLWGLDVLITERLSACDENADYLSAASEIQHLFRDVELPAHLASEIEAAHRRLGPDVPVAVRSSAIEEDTAQASFAGQHDSYLWVRSIEDVVECLVGCWASLFSPQALAYRQSMGLALEPLPMGVIVQEMVPALTAGVMFTLDPVTGDPTRICIEASYGLGVGVVEGDVMPDLYLVDKQDCSIQKQRIVRKSLAYEYKPDLGAVGAVSVPQDEQTKPCLREEETEALARLGVQLEKIHGDPLDIEWAIAPGRSGRRDLFLLQARSETVWSGGGPPGRIAKLAPPRWLPKSAR